MGRHHQQLFAQQRRSRIPGRRDGFTGNAFFTRLLQHCQCDRLVFRKNISGFGDAFNGGLACALARGESLQEAVRQASHVGALAVTRLGAQPSLPTAVELERFLASG